MGRLGAPGRHPAQRSDPLVVENEVGPCSAGVSVAAVHLGLVLDGYKFSRYECKNSITQVNNLIIVSLLSRLIMNSLPFSSSFQRNSYSRNASLMTSA